MSFSSQHSLLQKSYDEIKPVSEEKPVQPKPLVLRDWLVIAVLAFNYALMSASYSLQGPFFPKEAELKGATPSQYGFIFGVFELIVVIVAPLCPKLILYVSPHFTANAGGLLIGCSAIAFGFIKYSPPGTTFIVLAFVIRIFEGVGMALYANSSFNIVSSEFPDHVTMLFALLEGCFGVGVTTGPLIGGLLYELGGFVLPFFVTGCILVVTTIIQIFLPIKKCNLPTESGSLLKFLAHPAMILASLAIVSPCIMGGFNAATLEPHLRQFNLTTTVVSLFFIISGGLYAILSPVWGRLCDRGVNPYIFLYSGGCFTLLFYLLIGPVPFLPFQAQLWLTGVSLVFMGLGMSTKIVSGLTLVFHNTRERNMEQNLATQSLISTTMFSCCSIGAFIGPSLGGVLVQHLDYRGATMVFLFIELFLMSLYLTHFIYRKCRKQDVDPEKVPLKNGEARKSYTDNP